MDLDESSRVYIEVTLGLPRRSWKQKKIEKLFPNFLTFFFLKCFSNADKFCDFASVAAGMSLLKVSNDTFSVAAAAATCQFLQLALAPATCLWRKYLESGKRAGIDNTVASTFLPAIALTSSRASPSSLTQPANAPPASMSPARQRSREAFAQSTIRCTFRIWTPF